MSKHVGAFLLFSIFLTSCNSTSYYKDYHDKTYVIQQRLVAMSNPETDFDGKQIVKLEWGTKFRIFPFEGGNPNANEGGYDSQYSTWRVYPVEKIPKELLGKYLQKKVKINYKVVMFNNPPLIYIQSFELTEK